MVRDTTVYVAVTGSKVRYEAVSPPPDLRNHAIILNGRQEWWWEPGPVDSCCFGFPLEAGIVVMAGLRAALNGFLLWRVLRPHEDAMSDLPLPIYDPFQLKMQPLQRALAIVHICVGLASALAGLRAGCRRDSLAAKVFLWSWPASLALSTASWVMWWRSIEESDEEWRMMLAAFAFITCSLVLYLDVYFTKVAWSYYKVLKARDTKPSFRTGRGIELHRIECGDEQSGGLT